MKKKILVVERDKDILEIVTYILKDKGYDVLASQSEEGILHQILTFNPDAILLDIIQPSDQGTELCRQIKAADKIKHIPVIVLSTHTNAASMKEVCADDILSKPFDISELVDILKKQLVS